MSATTPPSPRSQQHGPPAPSISAEECRGRRELGKSRGRLLGILRASEEDDLPVGEAPPMLHVQHIYTKIGVSTRGAAALFAIEHGILTADA